MQFSVTTYVIGAGPSKIQNWSSKACHTPRWRKVPVCRGGSSGTVVAVAAVIARSQIVIQHARFGRRPSTLAQSGDAYCSDVAALDDGQAVTDANRRRGFSDARRVDANFSRNDHLRGELPDVLKNRACQSHLSSRRAGCFPDISARQRRVLRAIRAANGLSGSTGFQRAEAGRPSPSDLRTWRGLFLLARRRGGAFP